MALIILTRLELKIFATLAQLFLDFNCGLALLFKYFFVILVYFLNVQNDISFFDRLKFTRGVITSHVPISTQSMTDA